MGSEKEEPDALERDHDHGLADARRLYFYCTRFLIERVSWITIDKFVRGEGSGQCRLSFSSCKGLSYENMAEYLTLLRAGQSNVAWQHIDMARFNVQPHNGSNWLRAADVVASGVAKGLELSEHGFCEDRFARTIRPIVYRRGDNYSSYGMKFFPGRPEPEVERDNRYGWLSLYE